MHSDLTADPSVHPSEEEDQDNVVKEDRNNLKDVYNWALNESIELMSVHESVKFLRRINARIEQFINKYKIKKQDVTFYDETEHLSKSVDVNEQSGVDKYHTNSNTLENPLELGGKMQF